MNTPIHVWGYATGCPACTDLKTLLDTLGVPYVFHDITRNSPERAALRDAGFHTVPQAFTQEGLHLGDWSEFKMMAKEALRTLCCP